MTKKNLNKFLQNCANLSQHKASFVHDLSAGRRQVVNLSEFNEKFYHQNRAIASLEALKDILDNKFLCHIGCSTGIITQYFSKVCSKILALDIEDDAIKQTLNRKYNCKIDVKKIDAIEYLQKNPEINPEIFYAWTNGMSEWVDHIVKLRGRTNPTIILGIGLQKAVSPVENEKPLQLEEAKKLKKKYGGEIKLLSFAHNSPNVTRAKKGAFGLLILKPEKDYHDI